MIIKYLRLFFFNGRNLHYGILSFHVISMLLPNGLPLRLMLNAHLKDFPPQAPK